MVKKERKGKQIPKLCKIYVGEHEYMLMSEGVWVSMYVPWPMRLVFVPSPPLTFIRKFQKAEPRQVFMQLCSFGK